MFKLSSKNDVFIFSCLKRMRFFKVIFSEMNGICRKDIVSKTTRRHWPDSRTFFDIGLYMFVCSAFSCKPIQISVMTLVTLVRSRKYPVQIVPTTICANYTPTIPSRQRNRRPCALPTWPLVLVSHTPPPCPWVLHL